MSQIQLYSDWIWVPHIIITCVWLDICHRIGWFSADNNSAQFHLNVYLVTQCDGAHFARIHVCRTHRETSLPMMTILCMEMVHQILSTTNTLFAYVYVFMLGCFKKQHTTTLVLRISRIWTKQKINSNNCVWKFSCENHSGSYRDPFF